MNGMDLKFLSMTISHADIQMLVQLKSYTEVQNISFHNVTIVDSKPKCYSHRGVDFPLWSEKSWKVFSCFNKLSILVGYFPSSYDCSLPLAWSK